LGYKYFVHVSVWTQCLSDGCRDANTRTRHKLLKKSLTITTWPSNNLYHYSVICNEKWIHNLDSESEQQSMQNERIGQNCHFITLRNSAFFPLRLQITDDR